jgi:hypothetical protein
MKKIITVSVLLMLLIGGIARIHGGTLGARGIKAFFREGQTFITWNEDTSVQGEWYKVYMSDKPIRNVKSAVLAAKIPEGSRQFRWAKISKTGSRGLQSRAFRGFKQPLEYIQLEDDETYGKVLAQGTDQETGQTVLRCYNGKRWKGTGNSC